MAQKKSGVISTEQRRFIVENMNKLSIEEIAQHIDKNVKVVEKEIKNYVTMPTAENPTIRWHLKQSPDWKHLRSQFTTEELTLLENKYVKYVDQMKDDITATEETQIINMIKIEILMDRNLKGKMKIGETIRNLDLLKESIIERVGGNFALLTDEDRQQIMDIENQISSSRNVESHRTSEYIDLQKELNVIGTKLKTSRDQRVDRVLDARFSFATYVKDLMNREKQERESRIIELYAKSVDVEEKRLIAPHKYSDGAYDHPILSLDILNKLEAEDNQTDLEEENEQVTEQ